MENIGLPKSLRPRPFWLQYLCSYIVFLLGICIAKIKVNTMFISALNKTHFDKLKMFFLCDIQELSISHQAEEQLRH